MVRNNYVKMVPEKLMHFMTQGKSANLLSKEEDLP